MPGLAPYVSDEVSWERRVALYRMLFDRHAPRLLIANVDSAAVGYGLAYTMRAQDSWLGDTWKTGDVVGEIESLAVRPDHRGKGIGSRLLKALHAHLLELGVRDIVLGVLPGNQDAIRLYERHGYAPTWLYLSRLEGREP
jgi:ribosomal protein S18 acetylase RimI-like enzyme